LINGWPSGAVSIISRTIHLMIGRRERRPKDITIGTQVVDAGNVKAFLAGA
jgi:hypothetical protein